MLEQIAVGIVSPSTEITEFALRAVDESDPLKDDIHVQGHIRNISDHTLDEVKVDISYYDAQGSFLGLDMTSFTELDDMDPKESAPFDISLSIPPEAVTGRVNSHSKRVLQDIGVALKQYTDGKHRS